MINKHSYDTRDRLPDEAFAAPFDPRAAGADRLAPPRAATAAVGAMSCNSPDASAASRLRSSRIASSPLRTSRSFVRAISPSASATATDATDGAGVSAKPPEPEPEPKPDPTWFRDLTLADRRTARTLIATLESLDVEDPEGIAKAEMADGQPALAQLALERLVTAALAKAKDPTAGAKAAITAILAGEDDELGTDWQLVDGRGRRITTLEIGD